MEQHKLLLEQLDEEAKMKSQLQLELHKAEGNYVVYKSYPCCIYHRLCLSLNQSHKFVLHKSIFCPCLCSGLLEGYVAEKAVLEESLQQKENQEERLVEELEDLKTQLQQMQGFAAEVQSLRLKHQELVEENAILLRQKEHLSAGLGEREKGENKMFEII